MLGVVMMTGIMTVFEMALALTGQSFLLKPEDPYRQGNFSSNELARRDQQILHLIRDPDHLLAIASDNDPSKDFCDHVLVRKDVEIRSHCYEDGAPVQSHACDNARLLGDLIDAVDSQEEKFLNSCALHVPGVQRILLQPDQSPGGYYRLFSCAVTADLTCNFESTRLD